MDIRERLRPYGPHAPIRALADLRALLPEGHPVFLVSDVMDELDLTASYESYVNKSQRGQPPYGPRMMVTQAP